METMKQLFLYDEWANREALNSLRAAQAPPSRAVRLLAHIVAAQWLWLERIRGVPQSYPVWPEWTLEELERHVAGSGAAWREFLATSLPADLEREFDYTNTKGRQYRSRIRDTAIHVAMHGTYHRGQIALLLRQNGSEPAYTDFIEAVRTGKLAPTVFRQRGGERAR